MTPFNGRAIVQTVGKAVPLSEYPKLAFKVHIAALSSNTTSVVIGSRDVRASTGSVNGLPMTGGTRPDVVSFDNIDLSQWWVDAATAGEGVSFLAEMP